VFCRSSTLVLGSPASHDIAIRCVDSEVLLATGFAQEIQFYRWA
jgi:hypothetical protein